MKKNQFYAVAMGSLLLASCAQDEIVTPADNSGNRQICYSVMTDNGSRSATAYTNGTDVNEIHVAAWLSTPDANGNFPLPGYGSSNGGNAAFINHDILTRESGSGTFTYAENARFWPSDGQYLDFWGVVDAPENNCFSWTGHEGHPGLPNKIWQEGKRVMKDLLFAYTPDQTLDKTGHQGQQNVSFSFNHAFAKVVVTGEIKNSNLYVVITDAEIHGILDGGYFNLPYKSGQGSNLIKNGAYWTVNSNGPHINIDKLLDADKITLAKSVNGGKAKIAGNSTYDKDTKKIVTNNDILVVPFDYNGRNGNGKVQTYIQLKAYAFNIAGTSLDEDTDELVCGTRDADGNIVPGIINVPIEFNWVMGTVNTYNIIFDCGTGGTTTEDPKDPSLVRIGYEVEVKPWEDVDPLDKEYDFSTGKTK